MRILVIEDERALCETIVRSLKRLAYISNNKRLKGIIQWH